MNSTKTIEESFTVVDINSVYVDFDKIEERRLLKETIDMVFETTFNNCKDRCYIGYGFNSLGEFYKYLYEERFEKGSTFTAIGLNIGVSKTRVGQIYNKMMRRLIHPARSKYFRPFLTNYNL